MNFAISQAIASSNNNTSSDYAMASTSSSSSNLRGQPQHRTHVSSSQDNVVPFDADLSRMDKLETQVQRLGASLIDVNRKLDKLTNALLPKDTTSEGGDSDDNGGGPVHNNSSNFNLLSGGAFGSGTLRTGAPSQADINSLKGHHSSSSGGFSGNQAMQRRTFANLKKKKKVVGFGGSGSAAGGNSAPDNTPSKSGMETTECGLDAQEYSPEVQDLRPSSSQTFGKRRMSSSVVGNNHNMFQTDLDSGDEAAAGKDVHASVDSLAKNPLEVVPSGDKTSKTGSPTKNKNNPPAFSISLGETAATTKGFWDFEPYHTAGALNTVADSLFIFGATILSVMQISSLHPKAEHFFIERSFAPWWLVLSCTLLEILTGLWMILKSITREGENGWMSDTTKMTRAKYAKTFLVLDLLYTLPLEVCLVSVPLACYWSMTRHWLRWFRIYTLRISDNPFALSRPTIGFIAFLGGIVMIHHIMASIAWWQFSDEAEPGNPLNYLDALYWAVSTTTSTGYGDISPKEDRSRLVAMFSMISGGLIVAATTAFATSILTSRDALQEEHDKKKKMMQSMLEHYQIPWSLRQHVITLFPHVLQTHSESQFKGMMESLPPGLGHQLSMYVQAKMLVSVSVFKGLDNVTRLLPLVERLQQKFVNPQEFVVNQGDDSTEMYFLIFGTVQVIRIEDGQELILSTLFSGTVFGEMGVIRGTKRAASIMAVTACELMVLTKEDFDEAIQEEGLEELISSNLDNYTMPSQRKEVTSGNVSDSDHTPRGIAVHQSRAASNSGVELESMNMQSLTGFSPPEQVFNQRLNEQPQNLADGGADDDQAAAAAGTAPLLGPRGPRIANDTTVTELSVDGGSTGSLKQQLRRGSPHTDKSTSSDINPLGVPRTDLDSPPDRALESESFHAAPNRASTAQPNGMHSQDDTVNVDSD